MGAENPITLVVVVVQEYYINVKEGVFQKDFHVKLNVNQFHQHQFYILYYYILFAMLQIVSERGEQGKNQSHGNSEEMSRCRSQHQLRSLSESEDMKL